MKKASKRAWVIVSALSSLSLVPSQAFGGDPATAQVLFDQARKLMTQERYAEACPKLEESQRLDPGGGTLLHLAVCREHEGKTATAWAHYQDALAVAKRDGRKDRAKIAQSRIDALAPKLPRLRIRVASRNRKASGFRVSRDEANVGEAQWNESYPVDPGPHAITAAADGYKPWTTKIEIAPSSGETTVEVPELEADPSKVSTPVETKPTPPRASSPRIEEATRGDTQRTLGLVTGGVGGVSIIVGSVFGILSISKQNQANNLCKPPDYRVCTAEGKQAGDDGNTQGNVSTVAFIVGAALAGAGAALYFTAPSGTTKVGVGPSGASFVHAW